MDVPGRQPDPVPGPELTARILRMTESLQTSCREELDLPFKRHRAARMALAAVAAVGAAAVVLGAGGYVVGGPQPGHAAPGARGSGEPAAADMTRAWPADSGGALTRTALLDGPDLQRLRLAGWACPVLPEEGFTLRSAGGIMVAGQPTVRLTLARGGTTLTLFEQHPAAGAATVPVNAITGHRADADGFEPMDVSGHQMWVHRGGAWQAAFLADGASYTLSLAADASDAAASPAMTAQLAADIEAAAQAPADAGAQASPGAADDSVMARVLRGILRISGMR
ncbi:hypothetical protein ACQCSX_09705 [Pseudarthrobacter sp. P1]|uniref:hypothetical protein n=1 Tax=Pseudarthrobacter sp. P1 TaxID=3418418 RepID=UPI003CEA6B7C